MNEIALQLILELYSQMVSFRTENEALRKFLEESQPQDTFKGMPPELEKFDPSSPELENQVKGFLTSIGAKGAENFNMAEHLNPKRQMQNDVAVADAN